MAHLRIEFRPEITSDLQDALEWYESKKDELGSEFIFEFWSAVDRIEDGPEHYAMADNGFRPCRLHRFPYVVHYRIETDCILIIAVMAAARDDSAINDRG